MNRESIGKIAEMVKPHLQNARVLVSMVDGIPYVKWTDREGSQIAFWDVGIPSGCTNNPFTTFKTGGGYFSIWWDKLHGKLDYSGNGVRLTDGYWELSVNDAVREWLNATPFIASESYYAGRHITRGIWHAGRNRWMFGPKNDR